MMKSKLFNVNLDGATVNMGVSIGVAAKIRNRTGDHVVVTHCINHYLELSIMDLRKEEEYVKVFEKNG